MKQQVLKNITFQMLLISLVITTIVLVDIFLSEGKENLFTFSLIWICNMVGIIANIKEQRENNLKGKQN